MGDIKHIYTKSDILQKREFVNMVFDGNLYYEQGIYRTPTMLDIFSHNASIMEEKGYLIYKKKRDNISVIPHSGPYGTVYEPFYAGFKEVVHKVVIAKV